MRRFHGREGEVRHLSTRAPLATSLIDCGDGFDWRAPSPAVALWDEAGLAFAAYERGEWGALEPRELHAAGGVVGFSRCLSGLAVRATGFHEPSAPAGVSADWCLTVDATVPDADTLDRDADYHVSRTVMGEANAVLDGFTRAGTSEMNGAPLLVVLPSGHGALQGVGTIVSIIGSQVRIRFDEGSILYVPRT